MNIVQSAEKSDNAAIERIMGSLNNFTESDRDCVRELWEDYENNQSQSSYQFCTCRDIIAQTTQGFACFGKHALTENTFDLYWIAVDPTNQRTGAGSDLLTYVEGQVLAQKGGRLIIETSSTAAFEAARKFYRRHHYQREAVIRDFYAPGDHLVIFTKDLIHPGGLDDHSSWTNGLGRQPDLQINSRSREYHFTG